MLDLVPLDSFAVAPPKPARRYIAKALPHPSGRWGAQFAFPGVVPLFVSERGMPKLFESEEEAEVEAMAALFDALNNRKRESSKPERYAKLSGPDAAVLLAEANLTPTFFAYLYGTSTERVFRWFDEEDDVPHPVRILLEIFKQHPETIDTAESATEKCTTVRKPRRDGVKE